MDVPVHSFCGPDARAVRLPGWPDVGGRHPRIRAGHRQLGSSSTPVTYSLVYNGAYLIPDTLICLLLAALVGKRLLKAIKGN